MNTTLTNIKSRLLIQALELRVHLGWPDKERLREQTVLLNIDISFAKPPKACLTDHLDDTLCYATLIKKIRDDIATKNFHLIEHLGHEIYQLAKALLPDEANLLICITKKPMISGLNDGVSFYYGDK